MLESLTGIAETLTVLGTTGGILKSASRIEEDKEKKETTLVISGKKTGIGTTLATTATTATAGYHQYQEDKTLAEVNNAQEYVESMSEEELVQALELLGAELESDEETLELQEEALEELQLEQNKLLKQL